MRTLVTGGAGFIGSHLVSRLLADGRDVVVLDSLEEQVHAGQPVLLPDDVAFIHGDVGDPDAVNEALEGVDEVVHLAAVVGVGQSMYEIDRYTRSNTMATATFLESLVGRSERPRRLVVASSMSIYGEGEYECSTHGRVAPGPRPDDQLRARRWETKCPQCESDLRPVWTGEQKPVIPTSIYAITKRDHEELCLVTGESYGIPTVALRFFNVYGPGQALSNPYTGVAAIFASRLMNGKAPLIFEDGQQSRDFIHVTDIVEGIVRALDSESATGTAINLGTGRPTTVGEIARVLADGMGREIEPEHPDRYRSGDIRHCYADTSRAKALLDFEAEVSLEDGMNDLVAWLEGQEAADHVDAATAELSARGLTR
jgi:dTDP-L-rhamnose 4-epimerase